MYKTETQNEGKFAYFVSHWRGFSKLASTNVPVSVLRLNLPVRTPLLN